ncbi:MAG: ABC transporter permease [Promethearchaeota archaeon]
MNIILKKATKDFKKLGWRSYLIIAVIVLCLGGGIALNYFLFAAVPMVDDYFDDVNHADYIYQLSDNTWINQTQLDGLEDLDEIDDYTGRLFWTSSIQLSGQKDWKFLLLVGLDENIKWPKVFNYTIESGKNFNQDDNNISAVIDTSFAEVNDISIGDKIRINGLNDAKLKISGTCNAPEFLTMTSNPEYLFPIEGSMGVIFLSKDTLKNYIIQYLTVVNQTSPEDYTPLINYYKIVDYNNIAVTFKDDVKHSEGNKATKEYLEDNCNVIIEKAEKFEDSFAYNYMISDIEGGQEMMMILLIFMDLMGIIIVYVIFNRYVNSQKQQLGILEALGYSQRDIMRYFMFNIAVISIISIPLGIIVGFSFGWLLMAGMGAELMNVSMFEISFLFIPELLYFGIVAGLLIIFLSTYLPARKIKSKDIANLIYTQIEIDYKIKKRDTIHKAKKKENINRKFIFHNVFRNKKRLGFTIIAITFSLLIVASTQAMLDSLEYNLNRTFPTGTYNDVSENWDLNVQFQNTVNQSNPNSLVDEINQIDGVKECISYSKGLINAEGKKDQIFLLIGIDLDDSNVHQVTWKDDSEKNRLPKDDDEIIISSVYSIKLDKKVGDDLTFKNASNYEFTFKIVGIHADLGLVGYVSDSAGKNIFHNGQDFVDGVYLILDDDANKDDVKEEIYSLGNIEAIFDSKELGEKMHDFFMNYLIIFQIMIFYTLIVAFFIITYNAVMNIYDKNYEYGILRSLGYSKAKIFKFILIENILQCIVPIILTLIFAYPLTAQMALSYQEEFPFEIIIGLPTILLVIVPTLILVLIGSFIGLRAVYKQNLYEQVQTMYVG